MMGGREGGEVGKGREGREGGRDDCYSTIIFKQSRHVLRNNV